MDPRPSILSSPMVQINAEDPCSPACRATPLSTRVPPGPTMIPLCHSHVVAWPRRIPSRIPPPLLIRRVTTSSALHSPPFDRGNASSNGHCSSCLCSSSFGPRRVATATQELRHPFLSIAAPWGGWPSPDFCHQCPPTTLNCSIAVGTSYIPPHAGPKAIKAPSNLYRRDLWPI